MNIERNGKTSGRFPKYQLIINGIDIGQVKRKVVQGSDRLAGNPRHDVWAIHGTECPTQERAEQVLIERAIRFGYI